MKSVKKLIEMIDLDMTKIQSFPFQAQITYTALNGSRCVRVITDIMETSHDKEEVERNADFNMLGQATVQQAAKMARGGHIEKA
jgi:hypothetical protein